MFTLRRHQWASDKYLRLAIFALILQATSAEAQTPIPNGSQFVRLEKVVEGLNAPLTSNTANTRAQMIPIDMTPLGDGRQLVLTLAGHVRLLQADGTLAPGAFLDTFNSNSPPPIPTSGGEITDFRQIGNTSIAAHPGFHVPSSRGFGRFYTITSELPDNFTTDFDDGTTSVVDSVIKEWKIDPTEVLSATSLQLGVNVTQREIMRSARPGIIHTLVDMAFDPDEYLIITSGDGGGNAFPNTDGSAFNQDRQTNSLDPRNIFGSALRIDPLETFSDTRPQGGHANQYRIHPDNIGVTDGDPDTPGETFSVGLRSPYRINIDQQTGDIFVGDVGEGSREEISLIENGGNYGWGAYEGTQVSRADLLSEASDASPPLFELYHNLNGQSEATNVVGGFVYRGNELPGLQGMYIFADTGEDNGGQATNVVDLYYGDPTTSEFSSRDDFFRLQVELPEGEALPDRIWSIAEDELGELYLLVGPDRLDLFNLTDGETDGGVWKLTEALFVLNDVAGDVNQDGLVNGNGLGPIESDDVSAFIAGFATTGHSTPYLQYTNGDMNFDGVTDIRDWFILYQNHSASSNLSLASLLDSNKVPEPSACSIALSLAAFFMSVVARSSRR